MDRWRVPQAPKPPRIQALLRQALEFKARLVADPRLTRDALAREIKIDPSQLTRRLRLAYLAPEIQRHILALPPSIHRGPITERRLRPIAKIPSLREQLERFQELLKNPVRAYKMSSARGESPACNH